MPRFFPRSSYLFVAAFALFVAVATMGPAEATTATAATAKAGALDTVTSIPGVTGSALVLTLDPTTVAAFGAAGVALAPEGSATLVDANAAVSFPITSGYAELHSNHSFKPSYLLGSTEQFGSGLTLTAGATSVAVTDLVADLGQSMVYATIGTTEDIPLLAIEHTGLQIARVAGALELSGTLDLTPTAAAELDATFRTSAITPYLELGTAQIAAAGPIERYTYGPRVTEISRLSGISTSVAFDAGALRLFRRVGVTPGAEGSATYSYRNGVINFPITGGMTVVHPSRRGRTGYLQGVVLHQGSGLILTRGSTSVTMTDFTVEAGSATVEGSVNGGADNADLFSLGYPSMKIGTVGGNLQVDGALLDLTTAGAAMLNGVFATSDFTAGSELGTLDFTASGR